MGRSADEHEQEAQPETKPDTKREPQGRLERTRDMLELATPLVAVLMTLGSALLKLAVERLPTLEPIGVVLMAFFVFLSVSALRECPGRRGKSTAAVNEVYRFLDHDSTDCSFRS
jgi:hypothetical protein